MKPSRLTNAASKKINERSRVLIVLPTLGDRLDLLSQTLQSIRSQKPESPDIFLVCPNKKELHELAKEYKAKLVQDPAKGLSAALNAGFERAESWHEYGSWLGDDDLLRPGSIAVTTKILDEHADAVATYGYCDYIDSHGKVIFTNRASNLAPWIMRWGPNLVPLIGILYRLPIASGLGGYDTTLKYAMDLDMWLRLRKKGKFINSRVTLGAFRWHTTSTTVANRDASLLEAQLVKRRYLSSRLRPIAPMWELPVKVMTKIAAQFVNQRS
jgi:glycosyltransferase involved in cell wall biosynthesis